MEERLPRKPSRLDPADTLQEVAKEIPELLTDIESCRQEVISKRQVYDACTGAVKEQTEAEQRIRDLQLPVPDKSDKPAAYEGYLKKLQLRNAAWKRAQRNVIHTRDRWSEASQCIHDISQRLGVLAKRLPLDGSWPGYSRVLTQLANGITNPHEWFYAEPGGSLDMLKLRLSEMHARCLPPAPISEIQTTAKPNPPVPIPEIQATENTPKPRQVRKQWREVWAPHLRKARLQLGDTLKEAAASCGVHPDTYRKWEPGKIRPARVPAERHIPKILDYITSAEKKAH